MLVWMGHSITIEYEFIYTNLYLLKLLAFSSHKHGRKLNTTIIRSSLASCSGDNNLLNSGPTVSQKTFLLLRSSLRIRSEALTFFSLPILSIRLYTINLHQYIPLNTTSQAVLVSQLMQLSVATKFTLFPSFVFARSLSQFLFLRIFCFL